MYRILLWGNSSNSSKIFTLQKKIIRVMVGAHPRTPCSSLFKKLEILPVPYQYIFSLMNFLINNQQNFKTNSSVHSINSRNKHHLHRPVANLSCFQKSAFYSCIRMFNSLPRSLANLKNEKAQFKVALRRYLNVHSFYSIFYCLAYDSLVLHNGRDAQHHTSQGTCVKNDSVSQFIRQDDLAFRIMETRPHSFRWREIETWGPGFGVNHD
jgi:IS1 family transposase